MMVQVIAQTNSGTLSSVELFKNGIKNFGYIIDTDATPKAIDWMWKVVMRGSMYSLVCGLGLTLAVFAIGFWCVKFYKTIEEGGLRPALNEMVLPVLVVILLSNNGSNMRDMTMGTRDLMNAVNRSVTRAVSAEVNFTHALRTIAGYNAARDWIELGASNCRSTVDSAKITKCLEENLSWVKLGKLMYPDANSKEPSDFAISKADEFAVSEAGQWKEATEKWTKALVKVYEEAMKPTTTTQIKTKATEGGAASTPATEAKPTNQPETSSSDSSSNRANELNIASVTGISSSKPIRETILSMRGAFIYIIEVMMLVTGLVGPIFVALALFPSGANHLIKWGASFISLGFCKLCYSLISGLSALAMVYSGPENVDMLVASLILGLFAPVLAFGIASGSGIGILNTISYSSSTFGVNLGLSSYNPAMSNQKINPEDTTITRKN